MKILSVEELLHNHFGTRESTTPLDAIIGLNLKKLMPKSDRNFAYIEQFPNCWMSIYRVQRQK